MLVETNLSTAPFFEPDTFFSIYAFRAKKPNKKPTRKPTKKPNKKPNKKPSKNRNKP